MGILINSSDRVQFHNTGSLSFDGSTEYMTFDGLANDISTDTGTVSAWIKMDATSINGAIFKASIDSNNNIAMTYNNSAQKIQMQYKAGGTAKVADRAFAFEGNDTWYHLCMQYDTDSGYVKGYVDGELFETVEELGTWSGTIDKCYSARNTLAANSYFAGHIAHLSYFNTVVSATTLFNGGTPGNLNGITGLKLWLRMNEQTGTTLTDASGTGNNATLVNTPTWTTDKK